MEVEGPYVRDEGIYKGYKNGIHLKSDETNLKNNNSSSSNKNS